MDWGSFRTMEEEIEASVPKASRIDGAFCWRVFWSSLKAYGQAPAEPFIIDIRPVEGSRLYERCNGRNKLCESLCGNGL